MYLKVGILLLLSLSFEQCFAHKKKKTIFKKHLLYKPDASAKQATFKRQDMVFNDDAVPPPESDGPVGKAEAGVDGLGGDMHGYPTGMGAGAEPLGAFENEDTPSMGENEGQQSLDDKSDSFAPQSQQFDGGEPQGPGPQGRPFDGDSIVSQEQMKMQEAPKASPVSMSHSLDNLNEDAVNIQGDDEIGKFVRNHAKSGEDSNEMVGVENNDPPFTGEVDDNTQQDLKEGTGYREDDDYSEVAKKRLLVKDHSRDKKKGKSHHATWKKPFKSLQKKKHN